MSNRPNFKKTKDFQIHQKPHTISKIKTPVRLRFYHHIGDMAGCGTIRVIQPSMILNNHFSEKYQFEAIYNNRYTPYKDAYKDNSVVTFQRAAGQQQLDMIRHFKEMNKGKAVFYEIDDNLFDIPKWNFASKFYNDNAKTIRSIMRMVDGVICSTDHLAKTLQQYNQNINVSPNHLPRFIWGDIQVKDEESSYGEKTRIMYAGSHNHFDTQGTDKGDFSPKLIDFVTRTLDKYQWIFVGGIPSSLRGNEKVIHHEWQPVIEYPRFLKSMKPDICLAPLDNNKFNKSKSNIKALESVALGVPLVASDLEPYHGIPHLCGSSEEMIDRIEDLAGSFKLRSQWWQDQHDTLIDQLWWESNDYKNLYHYVNQHLRLFGKEL